MKNYNHLKIEKKWQKIWQENKIYKTLDSHKKPKYYVLDMFPYLSGKGLHVGHPKGYIATDIISRMKRMQGLNVMHPMGFDAFGLPAENYAIKTKTNPAVLVPKNVAHFKKQLNILGFDYDWSREINTTDPKFYKWTQWIFLQMFKKGLAYESYEPINWCPSCKTGLANEDLENGKCERCGSEIEQKPMRQWVLRITNYAERLLKDLDLLDWPEFIKESQYNWIGKSEGAEIEFKVGNLIIKVFTTRPDTLFGATYCVLAPEHKLVDKLKNQIKNWVEIEKYRKEIAKKTEIERTAEGKEKTGVELKGVKAINPVNNEEIPIYIADYVLAYYGTGAIMAVPAHDERDFEFAKKYRLPIIEVIFNNNNIKEESFIGTGTLKNSGKFDGMDSNKAKIVITKFVGGKMKTTYKLRDWVFSRQRYWGEPIPIIHCRKCGVVPVPEKDLPVILPKIKSYKPTGTGESPLADVDKWVNIKCPKCKGKAKRETNTMPQWAGSSWYYLRYMDPQNNKILVDKKKEKYWNQVDLYVGGAEHATRHLIYARFWHKFLYDINVVSNPEPFKRLQSVGLIIGEDGRKMSKRFGNIINPDEIVKVYGADTLRLYEMFMGPFSQSVSWSTKSIIGPRRFIEKIWRISNQIIFKNKTDDELEKLLHKTIKKITEDIETMNFNTAISSMMILVNKIDLTLIEGNSMSKKDFKLFLQILAPFAPHITEEIWFNLQEKKSIHLSSWPKYDEKKIIDKNVKIIIQINGKVRTELIISNDMKEEEVKKKALANKVVISWIKNSKIKRIIYINGRVVSIVI